jgi:hypothetical protein
MARQDKKGFRNLALKPAVALVALRLNMNSNVGYRVEDAKP